METKGNSSRNLASTIITRRSVVFLERRLGQRLQRYRIDGVEGNACDFPWGL